MEIIYRKLEELKKLENNPRTISDEQLDKLKESIRNNPDYFEARPIILSDRTGELIIIAGNQRYDACISLGMQQVPTVLIPNLTEERERELIIRDNIFPIIANGIWTKKLYQSLKHYKQWQHLKEISFGCYAASMAGINSSPRLKRYGRRRANISNGVMKTHGQQERLYNVPCLLDAKKVKEQKLLMNSKHNKKFHLHSAPTLSPDYVSI